MHQLSVRFSFHAKFVPLFVVASVLSLTGLLESLSAQALNRYSLSISIEPEGAGQVILNPTGGGEAVFDGGTEVTLIPIPAAGFEFSGWSGDATGDWNPGRVVMNERRQVTAVFQASGHPRIVAQPTTQVTQLGDPVTFRVQASSRQSGELTYRWIRNGSTVSGAIESTLTLSDPQLEHGGDYQVIVSNNVGSVASDRVQLHIYENSPALAVVRTEVPEAPLAAFNELGNVFVFNYDSNVERFNSVSMRTLDNQYATVHYSRNGLPTRLATQGQTVLFANYTDNSVDVSIVSLREDGSGLRETIRSVPFSETMKEVVMDVHTQPLQTPREPPLFDDSRAVGIVRKGLKAIDAVQNFFSGASALNHFVKTREIRFSVGGVLSFGAKQLAEWAIKDKQQVKGVKDAIDIVESFAGCRAGSRLACFKMYFESAVKFITVGQQIYRILTTDIVTAKGVLVDRDKPKDPEDKLNLRDPDDPFDPFQPLEPAEQLDPKCGSSDGVFVSGSEEWRSVAVLSNLNQEILDAYQLEMSECRGETNTVFALPRIDSWRIEEEQIDDYPVLKSLGYFSGGSPYSVTELANLVELGVIEPEETVWVNFTPWRALRRLVDGDFRPGFAADPNTAAVLLGKFPVYEPLSVDYYIREIVDSTYDPGTFPARAVIERADLQPRFNTPPKTERFITHHQFGTYHRTGFTPRIRSVVPTDFVNILIEENVVRGRAGEAFVENIEVRLPAPELYWNTPINEAGLLETQPNRKSQSVNNDGGLMTFEVKYDGMLYFNDIVFGKPVTQVGRWSEDRIQGSSGAISVSAGFYPIRSVGDYGFVLNQEHPLAGDPEPNDSVATAATILMNRSFSGLVGYGMDAIDYLNLSLQGPTLVEVEYFVDSNPQIEIGGMVLNPLPTGEGSAPGWRRIEGIPVAAGDHYVTVTASVDRHLMTHDAYSLRFGGGRRLVIPSGDNSEFEPNDGRSEAESSGNLLRMGDDKLNGFLGIKQAGEAGFDSVDVILVDAPRDGNAVLRIQTFDNLVFGQVKWRALPLHEYRSFTEPRLREVRTILEFDVPVARGLNQLTLTKGTSYAGDPRNGKPDGFVYGSYQVSIEFSDSASGGDGVPLSWEPAQTDAFSGHDLNDVAYGDGRWVAVGSRGALLQSVDGSSWDGVTTDLGEIQPLYTFDNVAFGDGRWLVSASSLVLTSLDGLNWTQLADGPRGNIRDLDFHGGIWVAVGDAPIFNGVISYSEDGEQWVESVSLPRSSFNVVAYGEGRWFAMGEYVDELSRIPFAVSADGRDWSDPASQFVFRKMEVIRFGGGSWSGIGENTQLHFGEDLSENSTGVWRMAQQGSMRDLGYGEGRWIAVGPNGTTAESNNARDWTFDRLGVDKGLNAIAYGNGGWTLVGEQGVIFSTFLNPTEETGSPPTIVRHPESASLSPGDSWTFEVEAVGAAPLRYQWQFNGRDISLAQSATFSIDRAQATDAGIYTVSVHNGDGSITSQGAELTIAVEPTQSALEVFASDSVLGTYEVIVDAEFDEQAREVRVPLSNGARFFRLRGGETVEAIRIRSIEVVAAQVVLGFDWEVGESTSESEIDRVLEDFTIADLGIEMVAISEGSFLMGSPDDEESGEADERPATSVIISSSFWMGRFEVTQAQYEDVVGENPSFNKWVGAEAPVEFVSWEEAVTFCEMLNEREEAAGRLPTGYAYRLPTEAQWEYACRAGTTSPYYFGDVSSDLDEHAWHVGNSSNRIHPVGEKAANPWGLHDMYGNVLEWCSDWYGDQLSGGEQKDPTGPADGDSRVVRGGSFKNTTNKCRSAFREGVKWSTGTIGFRPVLARVDN